MLDVLDTIPLVGELPLVADLRSSPIRTAWDTLSGLPGGKRLFSKAVGRMAPYTGTIDARVVALRSGYAKVQLKDRPGLRQHLGSVHAIALANLGELCTGLAMMYDFPSDAKGIVIEFGITYHKKARGLLTAECHTEVVTDSHEQQKELEGIITDASGDVVARARALWLIRPA